MKALLEEKFGSWHKEASQPDEVPLVPNTPVPQFTPGADTVYLVDRPGLTQVRCLWQSSWMTVSHSCCRVACMRREHMHCQTSLKVTFIALHCDTACSGFPASCERLLHSAGKRGMTQTARGTDTVVVNPKMQTQHSLPVFCSGHKHMRCTDCSAH